ncbi:MAG TPA: NADPH-dependent assimilatory sulfite reductase hemoprotein subunit [Chthoniobacterales bacterium]|nr:NADPH-dependent assimilatory sulfite reductase hemoprotein subunit [Chthoniobacterales bacterium]
MSSKNVEEIKAESRALRGNIQESLAADTSHFSEDEYQLLKFHGTYQQDDRDQRAARKAQNQDKAWMFMVRSKLPGGDLTAAQYLEHDKIARELGNGTLRVTTRQGFQTHGVLKGDLKECIRRINESGVTTWGACGDVVRNTIAAAAPISDPAHRDAQRLAKEISQAFLSRSTAYADIWLNDEKLPVEVSSRSSDVVSTTEEPIYGKQYLPRKFKIAIAIPPRNDVDVYANDLGFIAQVESGEVKGYTVVVGGGFGMTHGKQDTYPALAKPLGYVGRDQVIQTAVAIVTVQRDFGNRTDRKRARLKYLIEEKGIEWFGQEVQARLPFALQAPKEVRWDTVSDILGWHQQGDGKLFCGLWIQEGRIQDAEGVNTRSAFAKIAQEFGFPVRLTTNCNLIFYNIDPAQKLAVDKILIEHGVQRPEDLTPVRQLAQACVGLPTCGLALAESERAFPGVLDKIEEVMADLGLSEEPILIRMTGCPNGCARPYNADIAFVGRGPGKYAFYVGGSLTGERLVGLQQKSLPIAEIPDRVRELLEEFVRDRYQAETFSDYWGRTHVNGPQPKPEQFHVEAPPAGELVAAGE